MLALARALMPSPWMLLLDEPSEGIQPSIVQEIGQMLVLCARTTRLTMIVVEQNLDLVLDVTTRIAVLEKGRIAQMLDDERAGRGAARVRARAGRGARHARRRARAVQPGSRVAPVSNPAHADTDPHRAPQPVARAERIPLLAAGPGAGRKRTTYHGTTMATVKRPTLEQMKDIVASLHMSMSDREIHEYWRSWKGRCRPMTA